MISNEVEMETKTLGGAPTVQEFFEEALVGIGDAANSEITAGIIILKRKEGGLISIPLAGSDESLPFFVRAPKIVKDISETVIREAFGSMADQLINMLKGGES